MIKKLFSILLVFVLLCSNVCTAFADLDIEQQDNIVDSDNIILGNAALNNEDLVINGQKNEPDELLLVDNNNTIVEFSEGIRLVEKNAVEYENMYGDFLDSCDTLKLYGDIDDSEVVYKKVLQKIVLR